MANWRTCRRIRRRIKGQTRQAIMIQKLIRQGSSRLNKARKSICISLFSISGLADESSARKMAKNSKGTIQATSEPSHSGAQIFIFRSAPTTSTTS